MAVHLYVNYLTPELALKDPRSEFADDVPIPEVSMFITHVNELQPKLPIVIFTHSSDERMRILMRDGASWHFTKQSPSINRLAEQIHKYVFSPTDWFEIFSQYTNPKIKV